VTKGTDAWDGEKYIPGLYIMTGATDPRLNYYQLEIINTDGDYKFQNSPTTLKCTNYKDPPNFFKGYHCHHVTPPDPEIDSDF
jgi:hypothetical protein